MSGSTCKAAGAEVSASTGLQGEGSRLQREGRHWVSEFPAFPCLSFSFLSQR